MATPQDTTPRGVTRTPSNPSRAALLRTGSGGAAEPPRGHGVRLPPPRRKGKGRRREREMAKMLKEAAHEDEEEDWDDASEDGASFQSVVKIFSTIQEPDYGNPWQTLSVENATGSGVVILHEGALRILTAAHVVADQTFLQVQRTGVETPDKFVASVYAVWHECDLALLSVDVQGGEDEARDFWADLEPAEIGKLPSLRDLVLVAGFPVGGEELSITEGVVSRIEGQPYSHSQRELLAVTVDAAINAGNSGGPVFSDSGELVGIAFQALTDAENTGHIVPTPVIHHFLQGIARHGPTAYRGFPSVGLHWQPLTNPYLRKHLGMSGKQRGVLVNDVVYGNTCHVRMLHPMHHPCNTPCNTMQHRAPRTLPTKPCLTFTCHGRIRIPPPRLSPSSPCTDAIKPGDVLMAIGGREVADNGTVGFEKYGRVDFEVVVSLYQCGDDIVFDILRDKQPTKVTVKAKPLFDLVPLAQHDRAPPYFVYCGLVFQPLSLDYLERHCEGDAEFGHLLQNGQPAADRLQVIALTQTLTDAINVGYDELGNQIITEVDGTKPRDLQHLVKLIEDCKTETMRLSTSERAAIILPGPTTAEAAKANARILARYNVTRDRSRDFDVTPAATPAE